MAEYIVTPVVEIIKCFGPSIKLGAGYLVEHEKKIGKLRAKVESLKKLRSKLQEKVEAAEKNLETIDPDVTDWFINVDKEVNQDETLEGLLNVQADLDQTMQKKIKHFTRRFGVGKFISKKTITIDDLFKKGSNFSSISYASSLVHGADDFPTDLDFIRFPSRNCVMEEVMIALSNDETNLIEVYGMGGIGKTMLINQICNQVKEDRLFEVVVFVTVSQNVDLKSIQDTIADALQCQTVKKSGDTTRRALLLYERLKKVECILLVLDDIWAKDFELRHVGMPNGPNKGCKVLITSRIRKEYCGSHLIQKNIEVKTIKEEESQGLFMKNVRDVPDSALAEKIVKECNGLPIALVVLGKGLRNKDTKQWEDTARQLKNSHIQVIEDMDSKVFWSIKLSYNFLKNDIEKRCFLLCCLFPEDHKITVSDDLMMYFICDSHLHGFTNLEEVRGRLHTVLQLLTDSCLLMRSENKSTVWMHDIIRDVAISIAKEEHGFFVKAGMELTVWPSITNSRVARLSLMRTSISGLPDKPALPRRLVSISLEGNRTLKNIPDDYFRGMKKIETLDLRSTGISKLPSSISLLLSLRSLFLDYCVFNPSIDISLVVFLKKLVILSLQGCNLERLPQEIGELTGLKSLNLSNNKSLQVPPNIISRLSQLEELYMKESFSGWEMEGWQSEMKAAGLEELISLLEKGVLTTLHFSLDKSRPELLSEEDGRPSGSIRLDVTFGQRTGLDYMSSDNFIELTLNSHRILPVIKVLLERVGALKLKRSNDLESVAQIGPNHVGFKNMKSLGIEECNDLVFLMRAEEAEVASNIFSSMEVLQIYSMDNLERLFDGPVPTGFIDNLKRLDVKQCDKMVSIFDSNLLKQVPNLDELNIEHCQMLREIFNLEEAAEEGSDNVSALFKLRKICLHHLPSLEMICKGVIPNGRFDNLQIVDLYTCDGIKYLFSLDIATRLRQLKELKIQYCFGMVNLIAPEEDMVGCSSTAVSPASIFFPKLESIFIECCLSLEHLWVAKTLGDSDRNPVLLPELNRLELSGLPKLTDLHQGSTSLEYPCLQHLEVVNCENLKRICLSHKRTPKLEKIVGDDETWFESIEWENSSDKQHMHHLFQRYGESKK
ncbi:hypothetical protein C5167_041135 [Papaver somniferum]|uniref:Uncharacterized protein n=1 Tax=Papaver somniferum TaxID=3469 RepID=A0A4Y7IKD2_PAPSO|nr:disease resistance protein At4g27190-like [Papaver somniferum]RZC48192.1 hypothetical protein C5167_041135 [Papaver somniferum]